MTVATPINFLINKITLSLLTGFFMAACTTPEQQHSEYNQQVNQWHQQRITDLTEKDSWLSLTGLYQLHEGKQTFGADSTNGIIFSPPKVPGKMGHFLFTEMIFG